MATILIHETVPSFYAARVAGHTICEKLVDVGFFSARRYFNVIKNCIYVARVPEQVIAQTAMRIARFIAAIALHKSVWNVKGLLTSEYPIIGRNVYIIHIFIVLVVS